MASESIVHPADTTEVREGSTRATSGDETQLDLSVAMSQYREPPQVIPSDSSENSVKQGLHNEITDQLSQVDSAIMPLMTHAPISTSGSDQVNLEELFPIVPGPGLTALTDQSGTSPLQNRQTFLTSRPRKFMAKNPALEARRQIALNLSRYHCGETYFPANLIGRSGSFKYRALLETLDNITTGIPILVQEECQVGYMIVLVG